METRLKNESAALIKLVRTAFGKAKIEKSDFEDVNFKYVYKLAKYHDVANIVSYALKDVTLPEELREKFSREREISLYRTASQMTGTEIVRRALSENKITFCLLKGAVIRSLYPKEDMRTSGDVDVLYNKADASLDAMEKLMNGLGYAKIKGNKTVDSFSDGKFVVFEMHRQLCYDEDKKLLPKHFDNLLSYSQSADEYGFEKKMSLEDYYLFHISHMAKHFVTHGCGIRPLIDLYLFDSAYGKIYDRQKICDGLRETGLLEFERQCVALSKGLMDGEALDETQSLMLNVMMFSGVYGNMQRSAANEKQSGEASKHGGVGRLVKTAFLPLENMKVKYPILKKAPILLPAMWCVRIVGVAFTKSDKIKSSLESYKSVDDKTVKETAYLMSRLGLK